jgi:hypothetical protein
MIHNLALFMMGAGAIGFIEDPVFILFIAAGMVSPPVGFVVGAKIAAASTLFMGSALLYAATSPDSKIEENNSINSMRPN